MEKVENWNLQNIFEGNPEMGANKPFTPDLRLDRLKYDPNAVAYGILSDPASIGDGFGLALAHLTIYDQIIYDGITVFKPARGKEVDPKIIRLMTDKIIQKVPVQFYAYDIYMYNELRDSMVNNGIECIQHQLRLPDWEALKERIDTNRINGPFLKYMEKEMSDLKVVNGKVNHPSGGSKDMMDSVCQGVAYWDDPEQKQKAEETQMLIIQGLK